MEEVEEVCKDLSQDVNLRCLFPFQTSLPKQAKKND
jgi:hypothetical protein